jgi:hypothetical protein
MALVLFNFRGTIKSRRAKAAVPRTKIFRRINASIMTGNTDESEGLTSYYRQKIEHLELTVRDKTMNLRRLQAQRNELNSKGTLARADMSLN